MAAQHSAHFALYAVYRGGPQIWVAPTADDSGGSLASMRHMAIDLREGLHAKRFFDAVGHYSREDVLLPS